MQPQASRETRSLSVSVALVYLPSPSLSLPHSLPHSLTLPLPAHPGPTTPPIGGTLGSRTFLSSWRVGNSGICPWSFRGSEQQTERLKRQGRTDLTQNSPTPTSSNTGAWQNAGYLPAAVSVTSLEYRYMPVALSVRMHTSSNLTTLSACRNHAA